MGELEKIQSAKAAAAAAQVAPVTNHLTDAVNYLDTIQKHYSALNKTIKHPIHPIAPANDPPYGILKGGSKPSYRDWSHTVKHHNSMTLPPST